MADFWEERLTVWHEEAACTSAFWQEKCGWHSDMGGSEEWGPCPQNDVQFSGETGMGRHAVRGAGVRS